jgi:ribosomal protein L5
MENITAVQSAMRDKELEKAAHKILCDYGIYSVSQRIGILEVKKLMVKMANLQKEQNKKMYNEEEVLTIIADCDGSVTQAKKWLENFKK